MVKTWVSSYSPKHENLCFIAVNQRNCTLWLLIYVHEVKVVACKQHFFMDFKFVMVKEKRKEKLIQ